MSKRFKSTILMLLLILISVSLYSSLGFPTEFEPFADATSSTSTKKDGPKKQGNNDSKVVRLYAQPDFKGDAIDFIFPKGINIGQGGPNPGQDEKTYKATDVKSFIVPQGVQLIVLSFPNGKPNITKYVAGSYQISIPDVKGQYIITTTDK